MGPFYLHRLISIPARISNHIRSKLWDEITYHKLQRFYRVSDSSDNIYLKSLISHTGIKLSHGNKRGNWSVTNMLFYYFQQNMRFQFLIIIECFLSLMLTLINIWMRDTPSPIFNGTWSLNGSAGGDARTSADKVMPNICVSRICTRDRYLKGQYI